jgi:hypothetical protein
MCVIVNGVQVFGPAGSKPYIAVTPGEEINEVIVIVVCMNLLQANSSQSNLSTQIKSPSINPIKQNISLLPINRSLYD